MDVSENSANFRFGRWLSSPPPGEEVVISGISGRFPECSNVQELCDNLLSKKDMVSEKTRWHVVHPEIPRRSGFIPDEDKFDAGSFGIHHRQAQNMDPAVRKFLEVTVEAVIDAGIHPSDLEGSRTGVFVGYSWADLAAECLQKTEEPQMFGMTGYIKSMVAQRISYCLKLKGPSFVLDTACSSSLVALEHAFRAIRTGKCDQALVGGAHLTLHPAVTLQFYRVGVLSTDGSCKVFDQDANGYVRSDAISCIFLQKAKTSKRIYARIIHSKGNSDGFKDDGLLFPSTSLQSQLLKEVYDECGVTPNQLSYFEVHGTATRVGDLQEIQAVDEVIGKHRDRPLWIGSVKSNIGHSEPASGMSSIIKVLLAMETGYIAPNLHFKKPKQGMDALFDGRLVPVTEKVPWDGEGAVGVSNFGFGGSNCHVVLRRQGKRKAKREVNLPNIVCVSGRTREAVESILEEIVRREKEVEWIAMVQNVFKKKFSSHLFRGFVILTENKAPLCSIEQYLGQQPDAVYINFGNFEQFPIFRKFKNNLQVLEALGLKPLVDNSPSRNLLDLSKGPDKFLESIGRLYQQGYNPQVQKLYHEIEYPVSCGTPHISPLIKWNYDRSWYMEKFYHLKGITQDTCKVNVEEEEFRYIKGHVIDGRNLFPATGYLFLVWKLLAGKQLLQIKDFPIVFENCKFIRATTVSKSEVVFTITIMEGSGDFEISTNDMVVVTGRIVYPDDIHEQEVDFLRPEFKEEALEDHEIYKELYLRGYNYTGLFKGLSKCNVDATEGLIRWTDNWVTFMDAMLQLKILQMDTRLLYVPTNIRKLVINPLKHIEDDIIPATANKKYNIVKSGGVEIHGLEASAISKRTPLEPVLEKYEFVPNDASLDLEESVRINTQIILENSLEDDVKAVEIVDDFTSSDLFMPLMYNALENIPVVRPDLTISSQNSLKEIPGVKIEPVDLTRASNLLLVVGTKILQRLELLGKVLLSLGDKGFGISREEKNFVPKDVNGVTIVTQHTVQNEKLILFKKTEVISNVLIEISSVNWISKVQKALTNGSNIIIYSQNQRTNGILGLVNCIRREPRGHKVKCFFIMDEAPNFNPSSPLYKKQIDKNLAINVYQNSGWGTYRHLLLDQVCDGTKEHSFVSVTSRGDLSSLKWLEGPLQGKTENTVYNHYSAVNFKDIMTASGRVGLKVHRMNQDNLEGFEYSGKDDKGNLIMGMVNNGALSTLVAADPNLCWPVPNGWTLEDAATVPVVYSTVIYALLMRTNLAPGTSILIHSATGGIGIAALNVALHFGWDVFVTVGTQEKRDYLKTNFPQISDNRIGNSRDTSFEELIKKETKGRGVDVVLNSLAEEKLIASVRCLARGGRFMEIGKFDLIKNNALDLLLLEKEASYHGVMLDTLFEETADVKRQLVEKVSIGIEEGYVKPLPRTVFNHDEVEAAFRYMTTGKHIGKVLIRVKPGVPKGLPRFYCDPDKSYVILGGLGGFGLELADWLVLRGARKLVLSSRVGIQNGYQNQRIRTWTSYGASVHISTTNIDTKQGCLGLIQEANHFGPVDAVFNLAVVLEDALFEDQTEEKFISCLTPKAHATEYLDEVTRDLCPCLRFFVVFSSVSCGRGNTGQSNYGMANSIMERICEKRRLEGFPALAIQWGAVGDVGLVAKMQKDNKELVIGGTLQQKISSCLNVMDRLLNQNHPVVASMVVAEKRDRNSELTPLETVARVIGIKNMKTVSHQATLAELGMDSIMGTEVIQALEKNFGIYITSKEVRTLTLSKLMELESGKKGDQKTSRTRNILVQHMPNGKVTKMPTMELKNGVQEDSTEIFVFPGIEGIFTQLEPAIRNLNAKVFGVQYNYKNNDTDIRTIAEKMLPHIEKHLPRNKTFHFIGHSFGVLVALELADLLENRNYRGKIAAIDGSPRYFTEILRRQAHDQTEHGFETMILNNILALSLPVEMMEQANDRLLKCNDFNERLDVALSLLNSQISQKQKVDKESAILLFERFKSVRSYKFTKKLKSLIKLYKCEFALVGAMEDDYGLSELCEQHVEVLTVEGNHVTMLEQNSLVDDIRSFFKINV